MIFTCFYCDGGTRLRMLTVFVPAAIINKYQCLTTDFCQENLVFVKGTDGFLKTTNLFNYLAPNKEGANAWYNAAILQKKGKQFGRFKQCLWRNAQFSHIIAVSMLRTPCPAKPV